MRSEFTRARLSPFQRICSPRQLLCSVKPFRDIHQQRRERMLRHLRSMSALPSKAHALQHNFSGVAGFASKNLYQPILGLSLWVYASDIAGQGAGYEGKSILCDGGRVVFGRPLSFRRVLPLELLKRETSCWKPAPMATISLKAIARDMRWAWRTRLAR